MAAKTKSSLITDWQPMLTRGDQITEQSVDWLFKDRLPAGMVTLLSGDPDVGKTFFSMALAASVTTGGKFAPTESHCCEPGNVLAIHAEDSPEHTMLPRFIAAGGDRSRINFLGGVQGTCGISPKTMRTAAKDLGVVSNKGFAEKGTWSLPQSGNDLPY
jgi:hypothetical protein